MYNKKRWKRIKAVAMSRTRNAVVGVIRHVGSNPTASAKVSNDICRCFFIPSGGILHPKGFVLSA